ncbi:MAG: DUF2497 domain-containing protein [Rickettsiales bacterium]
MAESHFDVDSVLDSIKNKLLNRQSDLVEESRPDTQDVIELTEMVDDFGESLISTMDEIKNESMSTSLLSDDTVRDINTQLSELSEKVAEKNKFDRLNVEDAIRKEIRVFLKSWMDDNLASIVKSHVKEEIVHLVEKFKSKG